MAAALKRLNDGGSALDAVHAAIIELENGELTNAGKGSNLDLNGNVSCDASLMDSESGGWAGVGCLYNIQNPITAAHLLLSNQLNPSTKAKELGLVQPMLLVGSDATEWALAHGCSRQDDLTTS